MYYRVSCPRPLFVCMVGSTALCVLARNINPYKSIIESDHCQNLETNINTGSVIVKFQSREYGRPGLNGNISEPVRLYRAYVLIYRMYQANDALDMEI